MSVASSEYEYNVANITVLVFNYLHGKINFECNKLLTLYYQPSM